MTERASVWFYFMMPMRTYSEMEPPHGVRLLLLLRLLLMLLLRLIRH